MNTKTYRSNINVMLTGAQGTFVRKYALKKNLSISQYVRNAITIAVCDDISRYDPADSNFGGWNEQ